MLRLTKSMGFILGLSALLLVGCPKKYKPSDDAGPDGGGPENTAAACADGVDNDGDGDTDCADSECQDGGFCVETDCTNGLDDDGDGDTDCVDTDCQGTVACEENTSAACNDNIDNDGDGLVDCLDTECFGVPPCDVETICDDGVDNDADGDSDCDDEDCDPAAVCGGFCYNINFQTPPPGTAITPAQDLDSGAACIQYEVRVSAPSPEPNTMLCLYLDSLTDAPLVCVDPNTTNPLVRTVDLCAGTHTLYARVEQGNLTCSTANLGLEEITFQVYEAPSCSITLPTELVTVQGDAVCYNQPTMDVEVTTNGYDAELWINGIMAGYGVANMGTVSYPGLSITAEDMLTLRARCENPGSGNGDAWSSDYFINKDTQEPGVTITAPAAGTFFNQGQCPFTMTVTGVEDGATVCAQYQGGNPHANGCATSTGTSQTYDLTVDCVNGTNTYEAVATDGCNNTSTDTVSLDAQTDIPTVIIENPADAQVYSKVADTVDPGTDDFEAVITACTDGPYDPAQMELRIDSAVITSAGMPTVVAASCLGLSHRITWPVAYAFSQAGELQTQHTVTVTVSNGNPGSDSITFHNDTIAPILNFSCASCQPSDDFILPTMDSCPGAPVDVFVRVYVEGLESGQPFNLAVTSGGNPVGSSPYPQTSTTSGPQQPTWTCIEVQNGQNLLEVTAADEAGNIAVPAQKVVTVGDGAVLSPTSGALLASADDCDPGADYGIPVQVQVGHATVANGTSIQVTATSTDGGWSYSPPAWSKSCTGDPCLHTFCIPVPSTEIQQNDIAISMQIAAATVPGGPTGITVDTSPPDPPTGLSRTVVNRRAAEVQLDWTSVEDAQTGVLQAWDVRCVMDSTISAGNWAGAMQFAGEPTPASAGTAQTMNIAEDVNGAKIRAGHSYSCGIRGQNTVGEWSSVAVFADIGVADLEFVQYPLVVENYTWDYSAHINAAGDVNGDGYDDMILGYGDGTGHGAALYFGGANGPTASASLDIACADSTFGQAVTGIGDFDGAVYSAGDANTYPDIAIGAPEEAAVYIWRGHDGLDSATLNCTTADIIILGVSGSGFGATIQALGDFDGDGLADIAIGAPTADGWNGRVYVVFGRAESSYPGTIINLATGALARGTLSIESPFATSSSGSGLAAGDFDNDGFSDLVFASNWGGAAFEGAFSVLRGYTVSKPMNSLTPVASGDLDQVVEFSYPGTDTPQFGHAQMAPMDFNGDGCLDLVVGAERANVGATGSGAGNVLLYLGQQSGGVCTGALATSYSQNVHGGAAWDLLGYPVVPPLNRTIGVPEYWRLNGLLTSPTDLAIIAGARQNNVGVGTTGTGYVGLWYAGFTGDVAPSDADILISGGSGAAGQHWVAFVGDLDGDGYVDMAVGDPDFGPTGRVLIYH